MLVFLRAIVLDPNFNADFHRGVKGAVHRRAQDDQIANTCRHQEVKMIDGSGNYILAAVAMGSERAGHIDPVHEATAKKRIERVGIVR